MKDSECALLITEWDEFKKLTPDDFKKNIRVPNLVDGRKIFDYNLFSNEFKFKTI
ncbi:unnamed protein product, partial [marine sediment metagenome]